MNEKRLFQIIVGPHTTEKSVRASDKNGQVCLRVALNAHKAEIKIAVKTLFNVNVESVQTVRLKGKVKRFRNAEGRRSDWKKAYVTLNEGQEIKFADFV